MAYTRNPRSLLPPAYRCRRRGSDTSLDTSLDTRRSPHVAPIRSVRSVRSVRSSPAKRHSPERVCMLYVVFSWRTGEYHCGIYTCSTRASINIYIKNWLTHCDNCDVPTYSYSFRSSVSWKESLGPARPRKHWNTCHARWKNGERRSTVLSR